MATVPTDNLQQRYQQFHDENIHYQTNNWMIDDLPLLRRTNAASIIEIGCGNGRFLDLAAQSFDRVAGVDFARSPILDEILGRHPGIEFHQIDLAEPRALDGLQGDLVVSADVLEHLLPETLDAILGTIDAVAPIAWHTIACYEADWTHPSVFTPEQWLDRFRAVDPAYCLTRIAHRRGRESQPVATITKGFDFSVTPQH